MRRIVLSAIVAVLLGPALIGPSSASAVETASHPFIE
jgi:hypothetical protein